MREPGRRSGGKPESMLARLGLLTGALALVTLGVFPFADDRWFAGVIGLLGLAMAWRELGKVARS